jgi:hypothetical protein
MPPVGFELTTSAGKRPQTYALDRADIGTGGIEVLLLHFENIINGLYPQPETSNPHHRVFL